MFANKTTKRGGVKMIKQQKGFTLIELLVVIVIIGVLATLATVALGNARMKSRDARRLSDVKQIQTALELYYNDAGVYPDSVTTMIAYNGTTYMAKVPTNPTPVNDGSCPAATPTNSAYVYTGDPRSAANGNRTSYHIRYCLGGATGSITGGTRHASPAGIESEIPYGAGQFDY